MRQLAAVAPAGLGDQRHRGVVSVVRQEGGEVLADDLIGLRAQQLQAGAVHRRHLPGVIDDAHRRRHRFEDGAEPLLAVAGRAKRDLEIVPGPHLGEGRQDLVDEVLDLDDAVADRDAGNLRGQFLLSGQREQHERQVEPARPRHVQDVKRIDGRDARIQHQDFRRLRIGWIRLMKKRFCAGDVEAGDPDMRRAPCDEALGLGRIADPENMKRFGADSCVRRRGGGDLGLIRHQRIAQRVFRTNTAAA